MTKLLTALLAAMFATVTLAPVAIAQEKKDEKAMAKTDAKKTDAKKADAKKADAKKADAKKADAKKAEEKK
jgi:hypothetical protein